MKKTTLREECLFANREQFIRRKFDITGGCPRLMFEFTAKGAEDFLQKALDLLSGTEKKEVLFGTMQESHERSKNSLIHWFVDEANKDSPKAVQYAELRSAFSSKLVLFKLRSALDLSEFRRLYRVCQGLHRVIEGWALEELILKKLSIQPSVMEEFRVKPESNEGKTELKTWHTAELVSLKMASFAKGKVVNADTEEDINLSSKDILLLRPDTTSNESWDALLVSRQGEELHLKFLEITLQKTHSLSEMVLLQAYKHLKAIFPNISPAIKHVGIVDADVFPAFHFVRTTELPTMRTRAREKAEEEGVEPAVPLGFEISVSVARPERL